MTTQAATHATLTTSAPATGSKVRIAGHVLSGLVSFAMLASAAAKFAGAPEIVENLEHAHVAGFIGPIAVIEVICAILLAIPRTSSLGTLLVTGYFGGAVVAHLASNDPAGVVPALVLGALAWAGGYLRNRNMFQSFTG